MIVFKDIFNDCELATDASNPVLVDDFVYEFKATHVKRRSDTIDDSKIGGNKSAEDAEVGHDDGSTTTEGYDFVLDNKLEIFDLPKKNLYLKELKKYVNKIKEKLSETDPERFPEFKAKVEAYKDTLMKKFKKLQFYVHSEAILKSDDGFPGMIVILEFRENEQGEETYIFQLFKDGLNKEKY
ncbi:unnamed protein product, partial [Owenia fusiformis]